MKKLPKEDPLIKELKRKIELLEYDLEGTKKRAKQTEEMLKQRIEIDKFISTNQEQTRFAQLRACEARLHLAYTILDLKEKRKFLSEENSIYAQEYLNLIRSKVLI